MLGIPLELRCEIYKHFLQYDPEADVDAIYEGAELDFEVLWISSQIRHEAFDYLCTANQWIQLGL